MRTHMRAAVVVDEPAADAVGLLGDGLERDDGARGQFARRLEHCHGSVVGEVVQEVDHQHEFEALALGDQLGCIDAAECVPFVAAAAARVLDVGAVEVDAHVAPVRERGVLADPAADVEHARVAVEHAPAGE
jgi:hypothetical protein